MLLQLKLTKSEGDQNIKKKKKVGGQIKVGAGEDTFTLYPSRQTYYTLLIPTPQHNTHFKAH